MCRLFVSNQKDFYYYDKAHGILKLMDYLQKYQGGHGNGYLLVKDGKIIRHAKGQYLTNEIIYQSVRAVREWDFIIYHTRIASIGDRSDSNCHPFIDNNNALAMNGTVYDFQDIADVLNKTDSELIFKLVKDLKPLKTTHALASIGAIFVGLSRGKPYAVKGSGDLELYKKGTGSLHASSFPLDVPSHLHAKLDKGYIWINGTVIQTKTKTKTYDSWFGSGYRGYTSYGSYTTHDDYEEGFQEGHEAGYKEGYGEGFEDGQSCWETGISSAQAFEYRKRSE